MIIPNLIDSIKYFKLTMYEFILWALKNLQDRHLIPILRGRAEIFHAKAVSCLNQCPDISIICCYRRYSRKSIDSLRTEVSFYLQSAMRRKS
jgi:hypothetical protein